MLGFFVAAIYRLWKIYCSSYIIIHDNTIPSDRCVPALIEDTAQPKPDALCDCPDVEYCIKVPPIAMVFVQSVCAR